MWCLSSRLKTKLNRRTCGGQSAAPVSGPLPSHLPQSMWSKINALWGRRTRTYVVSYTAFLRPRCCHLPLRLLCGRGVRPTTTLVFIIRWVALANFALCCAGSLPKSPFAISIAVVQGVLRLIGFVSVDENLGYLLAIWNCSKRVLFVVVFSHFNSYITSAMVAGQAPVTPEWRKTSGKKHMRCHQLYKYCKKLFTLKLWDRRFCRNSICCNLYVILRSRVLPFVCPH